MSTRKFEDVTKAVGVEEEGTEKPSVQYLPFKIEYDGPATVQALFSDTSLPHPDLKDALINRFRGRPLVGKEIGIPSDYQGVIFKDIKVTSTLTEEQNEDNEADTLDEDQPPVHLTKRFDSMTYWNWDKDPDAMDSPVKLMDWLQLSQILHQPISK